MIQVTSLQSGQVQVLANVYIFMISEMIYNVYFSFYKSVH